MTGGVLIWDGGWNNLVKTVDGRQRALTGFVLIHPPVEIEVSCAISLNIY